jgi:hypothetical protein
MKLTTILPIVALAANAFARNVHVVGGLMAREIDPATMDPTKLSILAVLKTAIPTLSDGELALPTGDVLTPQNWIQNLSPEILPLLGDYYPTTQITPATATPTTSESDAAVSETAAASSDGSSPVSQEITAASADASSAVSEETTATMLDASASVSEKTSAAILGASSSVSHETAAETAAASSGASSSVSQEKASASAGASANASVSPTSLTKTLQTVPTATSTDNGTQPTTEGTSVVSNSAVSTGVHSTSKPSKPSSSQSASSTGAKNTVGTGSWSVAVGLSVAALFCLLA